MSTAFEATIGGTVGDEVNPYETFEKTLSWKNRSDRSAYNLTGVTIDVLPFAKEGCYPASIADDMTITITDAVNGVSTISMTPDQMGNLELGRKNWFRLRLTLADGTVKVRRKIWIHVS